MLIQKTTRGFTKIFINEGEYNYAKINQERQSLTISIPNDIVIALAQGILKSDNDSYEPIKVETR
jgi:hypothetical protein